MCLNFDLSSWEVISIRSPKLSLNPMQWAFFSFFLPSTNRWINRCRNSCSTINCCCPEVQLPQRLPVVLSFLWLHFSPCWFLLSVINSKGFLSPSSDGRYMLSLGNLISYTGSEYIERYTEKTPLSSSVIWMSYTPKCHLFCSLCDFVLICSAVTEKGTLMVCDKIPVNENPNIQLVSISYISKICYSIL